MRGGSSETGSREHARPQRIIPADLFRDALIRERCRSDRFEQPFLLLVIQAATDWCRPVRWNPVFRAVSAAKREMDIVGWLHRGTALGIIVPEVDALDPAVADRVVERLRREVSRRLPPDAAAQCLVRTTVYCSGRGANDQRLERHLLSRPPGRRRRVRAAAKRMVDVCGSGALLLLLSPVFFVVAALVRLTSAGPILFRQTRIGRHGAPFTMLKFRTMQADADERIHQHYVDQFIRTNVSAAQDGRAVVYKLTNDDRITPVGRVLRRTSLDELPQFWNVLKGDMSLVGPRPPLPYEVARYRPWHRRRVLDAVPGVTGLWQVTGRSRTTFDEMVRLDLQYARNLSLLTDLRILLATPRAVVTGKGAV